MNFLLLNTLTSSASMLLNVTCIMLSCNVFTSISLRILSTSTDAEKKISGLSTNKNSEQSLCYKNTLQCKAYIKTIGFEDNSTRSDYNTRLHIVKIY